ENGGGGGGAVADQQGDVGGVPGLDPGINRRGAEAPRGQKVRVSGHGGRGEYWRRGKSQLQAPNPKQISQGKFEISDLRFAVCLELGACSWDLEFRRTFPPQAALPSARRLSRSRLGRELGGRYWAGLGGGLV